MKIYVPDMCIGEICGDIASFRAYLESLASPGTEVTWETTDKGTASIESVYDEVMCAPFMVRKIQQAHEKGYDAAIIYCMSDPGLVAAREATDIPVVGLGLASMIVAVSLGRRFSILGGGPETIDQVRLYGLESHLASVRTFGSWGVDVSVPELHANLGRFRSAILEQGRKAVEEDGADVLIMGCGFMSGISEELQAELGVPVLDPDKTAIRFTEMLVQLGQAHSKKAYPFPTPKPMRI
jgi:allantoin racemase